MADLQNSPFDELNYLRPGSDNHESQAIRFVSHREGDTMSRQLRLVLATLLAAFVLGGFTSIHRTKARRLESARSFALTRTYRDLPLTFERNDGQTDPRVKFLSRANGYTLFLTSTEAVLALRKPESAAQTTTAAADSHKTQLLHVELLGAQTNPKIEGLRRQAGRVNYFVGNDPKKWRTNVSTYAEVKYDNLYPGIDLAYHGSKQGQLEYDFVVAPGADPNRIQLSFEGADSVRIDKHGDLIVSGSGGDVTEHSPLIYQQVNGSRHIIQGGYALKDKHTASFRLAAYDANEPLVIDPTLVYATYLGGTNNEASNSVAADSFGNAYVAGYTNSANFPTSSPLQAANAGGYDAYVTKLNGNGSGLIYSTYLGGSGFDGAFGIQVDSSGNAYVVGVTGSSDFPTTASAFQTANNGLAGPGNLFVTKLNSTGSALVYSTYLGGSVPSGHGDMGSAIASIPRATPTSLASPTRVTIQPLRARSRQSTKLQGSPASTSA
jgi:beta-propeller repeat-containing protein